MIYVTGDTHGEYERLKSFDEVLSDGDLCIICGDFGYVFKDDIIERKILDEIALRPYTLLFVDGNHENFTALYNYPEETWNGGKIHRIRNNIIHLCRGQVFEIEGHTFFTFGGGNSIDRMMRREGISWWPQEMPNNEEYSEADRNLNRYGRSVDFIITHAAPEDTMSRLHPYHADEKPLNNFLEYIRETVTYKHWFMGHLHRDEDLWRNQSILWENMIKIEDDYK